MNKYTTFEWVKKVISSVENNSQDIVSEQLIMNFEVMFNDHFLTSKLWSHSTSHMNKWLKLAEIKNSLHSQNHKNN